jgi:hypothetical protein
MRANVHSDTFARSSKGAHTDCHRDFQAILVFNRTRSYTMRMTVQFQDGSRSDALLLAVSAHHARVIVAGRGTTEEWILFDGHCFDERGGAVTIESLVVVADTASASTPKAMSAGSISN